MSPLLLEKSFLLDLRCLEISLISAVNNATCASMDPVFFALPPNSATIEDFLSFVTLDISVFFNSSLVYIKIIGCKGK